MAEPEQRYNFICPNCSGNFSIQLDRIPPVQARFRCPHCKEPMDFPSREEARLAIRRQAEAGPVVAAVAASASVPAREDRLTPVQPTESVGGRPAPAAQGSRFRVDKAGFQADTFDRRGIRNLIRTREVLETDRLRIDDAASVPAGEVPYLKSLFSLAKGQKTQPPPCCRTHTDRVAFFKCHDSGRPLCEPCAPEKKFGGSTIRVCQHCGGTATDLLQP